MLWNACTWGPGSGGSKLTRTRNRQRHVGAASRFVRKDASSDEAQSVTAAEGQQCVLHRMASSAFGAALCCSLVVAVPGPVSAAEETVSVPRSILESLIVRDLTRRVHELDATDLSSLLSSMASAPAPPAPSLLIPSESPDKPAPAATPSGTSKAPAAPVVPPATSQRADVSGAGAPTEAVPSASSIRESFAEAYRAGVADARKRDRPSAQQDAQEAAAGRQPDREGRSPQPNAALAARTNAEAQPTPGSRDAKGSSKQGAGASSDTSAPSGLLLQQQQQQPDPTASGSALDANDRDDTASLFGLLEPDKPAKLSGLPDILVALQALIALPAAAFAALDNILPPDLRATEGQPLTEEVLRAVLVTKTIIVVGVGSLIVYLARRIGRALATAVAALPLAQAVSRTLARLPKPWPSPSSQEPSNGAAPARDARDPVASNALPASEAARSTADGTAGRSRSRPQGQADRDLQQGDSRRAVEEGFERFFRGAETRRPVESRRGGEALRAAQAPMPTVPTASGAFFSGPVQPRLGEARAALDQERLDRLPVAVGRLEAQQPGSSAPAANGSGVLWKRSTNRKGRKSNDVAWSAEPSPDSRGVPEEGAGSSRNGAASRAQQWGEDAGSGASNGTRTLYADEGRSVRVPENILDEGIRSQPAHASSAPGADAPSSMHALASDRANDAAGSPVSSSEMCMGGIEVEVRKGRHSAPASLHSPQPSTAAAGTHNSAESEATNGGALSPVGSRRRTSDPWFDGPLPSAGSREVVPSGAREAKVPGRDEPALTGTRQSSPVVTRRDAK